MKADVVFIEAFGRGRFKASAQMAFHIEVRKDETFRFVSNRKWNVG